jgi:hypothetical protein
MRSVTPFRPAQPFALDRGPTLGSSVAELSTLGKADAPRRANPGQVDGADASSIPNLGARSRCVDEPWSSFSVCSRCVLGVL